MDRTSKTVSSIVLTIGFAVSAVTSGIQLAATPGIGNTPAGILVTYHIIGFILPMAFYMGSAFFAGAFASRMLGKDQPLPFLTFTGIALILLGVTVPMLPVTAIWHTNSPMLMGLGRLLVLIIAGSALLLLLSRLLSPSEDNADDAWTSAATLDA